MFRDDLARRLLPFQIVLALSAGAHSQGTLHSIDGDAPGDRFGSAVGGGGDVDGDGFPDVIVGAYSEDDNGEDAGTARVFSGRDGELLYLHHGGTAGDFFGDAVACAGDVDADGFADFVVGARYDDQNGSYSGSVHVFSGADGSLLHAHFGEASGDRLGNAVAGGGDVDADGFDDLAAGAYFASDTAFWAGSAFVFSGKQGKTLHAFHGDAEFDFFGSAVALLGDVDDDGRADVMVGAYGDDDNGPNTGSARIFSGGGGAEIVAVFGSQTNARFGSAASGVGDADGDGKDDIAVGAWLEDTAMSGAGTVRVYSGKDGALLFAAAGAADTAHLGYSVGGAGDVNGDGRGDVVVGAPSEDGLANAAGKAHVLSGADGSPLFAVSGEEESDFLGGAVSGAGDVNQDGYADVIVGQVNGQSSAGDPGSALVISGTCGAIVTYGTGCAGSSGLVPKLGVDGCATPGGALALVVEDGQAASSAHVLVGLAEASQPLAGGCVLLVTPLVAPVVLPLSASGGATLDAHLPVDTPPATLFLQAFVPDSEGPAGYSATGGVRLVIE